MHAGAADRQLKPLRSVQNTVASFVLRARRCHHMSPILQSPLASDMSVSTSSLRSWTLSGTARAFCDCGAAYKRSSLLNYKLTIWIRK